MNANIMKTQIFHKIKYDLKGHIMSLFFWRGCVFSTLRSSDLITTLTYVVMDNFNPCSLIDHFILKGLIG